MPPEKTETSLISILIEYYKLYLTSTMQKQKNKQKPQRFAEVKILEQRIKAETPKSAQYFYDYKLQQAEKEASLIEQNQFHTKFKINFADLPISQSTLKGLNHRGFSKMTEVQRCSIPHALADRDLLVSSRTGSGKTLAYLVPLVEKLYRKKFIPLDGLGAVVIVPVRELAMQVFEVLNSFTQKMQLSIGLIIGGKDVKYEQGRIGLMNILVCTPGRFLQHLQQTYGFQTGNLQMLVLDEADVMMEMGFKQALKGILQHIPKVQTLMFSATMTRDIMNLSSLCTSQPEKILLQGVNIQKQETTDSTGKYQAPAKLSQYYMLVSPQDKINTFYSFLKSHPKQKIVVFVSTCKQVRFLYQSFRKFRLGTPLYQLQGHQKQKKRMAMYFTFCQKRHGVLLCTNIAARGLDFPLVDWVFQFDVPELADTYVHRVGRTARYKAQGKSLLLLSQHQMPLIDQLKAKNIQIHKITQNPQRYLRVEATLRSICSQHQDVKYLAQRALISYLRFVFKAQNKKLFNLKKIDLQKFALSFGLPSAPNLNIKNQEQSENQGQQSDLQKQKLSKIQKLRLKQKMKKAAIKQSKLEQKIQPAQESQQNEDQYEKNQDQQDLLVVKGVIKNTGQKVPLAASKRQLKKIKPQGHFQGKNQIFFDEYGNALTAEQYRVKQRLAQNKEQIQYNTMQVMQERLQTNKQADEQIQRERRKLKRRKRQTAKEIMRRGGQRVEAVLDQDQDQFQ